MASDTWGNVSATRLRNTVSDRRIVTPEKIYKKLFIHLASWQVRSIFVLLFFNQYTTISIFMFYVEMIYIFFQIILVHNIFFIKENHNYKNVLKLYAWVQHGIWYAEKQSLIRGINIDLWFVSVKINKKHARIVNLNSNKFCLAFSLTKYQWRFTICIYISIYSSNNVDIKI